MRKYFFLLFVVVLTIPAFFRMLRPGIYSMQDPHLFRLFEFDRCIKDFQIPCRWAPDAGFGYGEPLFNFYTQIPYAVGEVFHLLGMQIIDSTKVVFILSIIGSALGMYLLSLRVWGNQKNQNSSSTSYKYAALVSSMVYVYAPYRALDVWVRAALPEAFAFALFPFIALFAYNFLHGGKIKSLLWFSVSLALLLLTHNLSLLMFGLFLGVWLGCKIVERKNYSKIPWLVGGGVLALALSAFYLLPVVSESKYVNLESITIGYFDFRAHFATLNQLLISRFWGYGASLFGPQDDLSLSVGQVQWVLPLIALVCLLITRQKEKLKDILVLVLIGWLALFLTHNKSTPIWESLKFTSYFQFPWRWLSIATFSFALASGAIVFVSRRFPLWISATAIVIVILVNFSFFKEDMWYNITDKDQFAGKKWEEQTASSLGDYWPATASQLPASPAPSQPSADGRFFGAQVLKKSNEVKYKLTLTSPATVQFPIVYFPGWHLFTESKEYSVVPSGDLGLITAQLPALSGEKEAILRFTDTPARTWGNAISVAAAIGLLFFVKKNMWHKRSKISSTVYKKYWLLIVIVLLGFVLRFAGITQIPPSLNWDEVSHGWNAYSILKTGQDEWGEFFPITNFRAYGDYPLPLNLYLTIPFIKFLGLNAFAIRLPHVLLGTLTIISSYFVFFGVTKRKDISLFGTFFVAIDPWLFFPSRFVLQSNLSVFFLTTAAALFVNGKFPLSFLAFGLTLFSYHTTRIFTPFFLLALFIIYRRELFNFFKHKRLLGIISLVILAVFFVPLPFILSNSEARARANWVFLVDQGAINRIVNAREESKLPPGLARLFYNRPVYFVEKFTKNYADYFSPQFLFFKGGTQYQFSVPGWGLLYPVNLPFFYIGLILVAWRATKKEKAYQLVLLWLLLAPIPASITNEKFAVLRSASMLPIPQLISAIGVIWLATKISRRWKAFALTAYATLLFVNMGKYMYEYFFVYSRNYSWSWQYGYQNIADYIKACYGEYDRFIITKKYGEPHEFLLFYWPWDPAAYQKDTNLVRFAQSDWFWIDRFDKFYFVNDWDMPKVAGGEWRVESGLKIPIDGKTLLVTSPGNFPPDFKQLKTIRFLNGDPAFIILEKQ